MKHVFAVQNQGELLAFQAFVGKHQAKLEDFLSFLKENYSVTELPRCVIWTDMETATHLISDLPIPAYTNEFRTVFCPELQTWKKIYLHQLDGLVNSEVRTYYENCLSENHILQILGHEFVHYSDLFLDDFQSERNSGIWFEEGMCEYISRRYFLSDMEFNREAQINETLAELYADRYGIHPLEDFGEKSYTGDYFSIFFEYWRSFLAVQEIISRFSGDVQRVFDEYHIWSRSGKNMPLTQWFDITE